MPKLKCDAKNCIYNCERFCSKSVIHINDDFDISLVIALGYPNENIIIEDIKDGNFKYWRDEKENHYVPKRPFEEIIIK